MCARLTHWLLMRSARSWPARRRSTGTWTSAARSAEGLANKRYQPLRGAASVAPLSLWRARRARLHVRQSDVAERPRQCRSAWRDTCATCGYEQRTASCGLPTAGDLNNRVQRIGDITEMYVQVSTCTQRTAAARARRRRRRSCSWRTRALSVAALHGDWDMRLVERSELLASLRRLVGSTANLVNGYYRADPAEAAVRSRSTGQATGRCCAATVTRRSLRRQQTAVRAQALAATTSRSPSTTRTACSTCRCRRRCCRAATRVIHPGEADPLTECARLRTLTSRLCGRVPVG
jgi:hypothetical protein